MMGADSTKRNAFIALICMSSGLLIGAGVVVFAFSLLEIKFPQWVAFIGLAMFCFGGFWAREIMKKE